LIWGKAVVVLRRDSNQRKAPRKQGAESKKSGNGRNAKKGSGPKRTGSNGIRSPFVLYVEGARDREILACWARRIGHELSRVIEDHAFIMGGRRPARALSDFRKRGGLAAGLSGLVVLDRDDHSERADQPAMPAEEGLDVFVWSRRHIESYLLVPAAIRRLVGLDPADRRIERFVEEEEHDADAIHAKRVLGTWGSLSEVIGVDLRAGEIARAMRREEFHPDIFALFDRIAFATGVSKTGPEIVVRTRPTP
jgi:hypothetical protein